MGRMATKNTTRYYPSIHIREFKRKGWLESQGWRTLTLEVEWRSDSRNGNLGSFRPDQGALYLFTLRSDSHSNTNMRYFSITQNATTEQLPFHIGCLAANQEPAGIIATAMLRYFNFCFVLLVSALLLPSVARAGSRNESVCTFSGSA